MEAAVLLDGASFRYVDVAEEEGEGKRLEGPAPGARVDDISFWVAPGRCTVLCGRSGGGKSTVLRMIDGLAGSFFPGVSAGVSSVFGTEARLLSPRERTGRMGVVMQDPRSQFFMGNVFDELAFSSENLGVEPGEVVQRVRRAARLCGVESFLADRLSELSSGQKQRVALAAAIAGKPRLLVLDEPLSNLDAQGCEAFVKILAKLKQEGMAVVASEHRLHRLLDVADDYLCLDKGRLVARWSSAEFEKLSAAQAARYGLRHPAMSRESSARAEGEGEGGAAGGWLVEGLGYAYASSKRGVEGVSARFADGSVTVVQGDNGAGKTTLAKLLCGVLREQAGSVSLDGAPASRRARRQNSYFVMQDADYQLYAGSVADEVVLGRRVDEGLKARAWEALAAFGLTGVSERHPQSLSGGQKQRVTLAAAYCSDARLIVLDEPTSGLDGKGVQEVAAWCRALAGAGKAVVLITHDRLVARLAGDSILKLGG